jgi:hypothetical protein
MAGAERTERLPECGEREFGPDHSRVDVTARGETAQNLLPRKRVVRAGIGIFAEGRSRIRAALFGKIECVAGTTPVAAPQSRELDR